MYVGRRPAPGSRFFCTRELTGATLRPVAEKVFRKLTTLSSAHPELRCIAVSHSSPSATEAWIPLVGGAWEVEVVVDEQRDLYAQWGLGVSSTWHVFNPQAMYATVALGRKEGIWNRPTESGTRWQTGGAFAVGMDGVVRWAHVSSGASDVPDFDEVLRVFEQEAGTAGP